MVKLVKSAFSLGVTALLSLGAAVGYYAGALPDSYYVQRGEALSLHTAIPIATVAEEPVVQSLLTETETHAETMSLRLFGLIPIKTVEVTEVDAPLLIPGGEPFGIKLLMAGVMVIGMGDVDTAAGGICPAECAGIAVGDVILSVDETDIDSSEALQEAIAAAGGEAVRIALQRGESEITLSLTPAYAESAECYQAGLWVRDSTAGIGTVTYYEPDSGDFAGLGHPVCDVDTGEMIPLSSGEVVGVTINNVIRGTAGAAGELQGYFNTGRAIGTLQDNYRCGVYGTLSETQSAMHAIPLGMKQEIQQGEAELYTTISGETPQAYEIVIEKIDYKGDGTKNMVVQITDPALLEATGGIVQGMSGSPIVQDGKLVGAVTHVFVSDPTRGYAVFAETMYTHGR